jgi:hypothetical protein
MASVDERVARYAEALHRAIHPRNVIEGIPNATDPRHRIAACYGCIDAAPDLLVVADSELAALVQDRDEWKQATIASWRRFEAAEAKVARVEAELDVRAPITMPAAQLEGWRRGARQVGDAVRAALADAPTERRAEACAGDEDSEVCSVHGGSWILNDRCSKRGEVCAACGKPDPGDGPTGSDGKPYCGDCAAEGDGRG